MSKDTIEKQSSTTATRSPSKAVGEVAQSPPQGAATRQQIDVDASHALTLYANFCRVTGTPEELILDFALNSNAMPTEDSPPVEIQQRLVVNYFTAKRMLQALHMSVQRHEQAFGVLETDVAKRVVSRTAPRNG
jgi:hypothetical protein